MGSRGAISTAVNRDMKKSLWEVVKAVSGWQKPKT